MMATRRRILVLAFGLREIAAAQQLNADGIEITGADRGVERIDARDPALSDR